MYTDAEERAAAAVEFFTDVLEFKPENVKVCRNYSKSQVIELLDKLHEEAKAFEMDSKNGPRDVNAIYINWVGFCIHPSFHPFMSQLDYSEEISSPRFALTKSGETISIPEFSLKICQSS